MWKLLFLLLVTQWLFVSSVEGTVEWIQGQLSPPCSAIKYITLFSDSYDGTVVPVTTENGKFSTAIHYSSSNIVLQTTGCGWIYRATFYVSSENQVLLVGVVQQVEASTPSFIWSYLKSPLFWFVSIGILFLLFVPHLAQVLDDDLYEVSCGKKNGREL